MPGRSKRRLRALLRRGALDGELDEELRHHLEREVELHVAGGMSAGEARREFGGVTRAQEACREARGVRFIEELLHAPAVTSSVRSGRERPLTFLFVPLLLVRVALPAGVLPAWKASKVDPSSPCGTINRVTSAPGGF